MSWGRYGLAVVISIAIGLILKVMAGFLGLDAHGDDASAVIGAMIVFGMLISRWRD